MLNLKLIMLKHPDKTQLRSILQNNWPIHSYKNSLFFPDNDMAEKVFFMLKDQVLDF